MSHYFDASPTPKSSDLEMQFTLFSQKYSLKSDNGVFSKHGLDIGTEVLIKAAIKMILGEAKIELPEPQHFLDLGCGIGPITLVLKNYWPHTKATAVDINQRAVGLARKNLQKYHQTVEVIESDGLQALHDTQFDFIISNPPIRIGKTNLKNLLNSAYAHLQAGGMMLLVFGKKQGANSWEKYLQTLDAAQVLEVDHASGFKVFLVTKRAI